MTDDQRRDLPNLMLLCDPHHQQVDSKEREHTYTLEVLQRWKFQRESDPREALARLREVSPSALREIVAEGLNQRDAKILNTLGRLEERDKEAAALMRSLVDELTESYSRMREGPSNEIMEMFATAVGTLPPSDVIESFSMAAHTLSELKETLDNFNEAAYQIREGLDLETTDSW